MSVRPTWATECDQGWPEKPSETLPQKIRSRDWVIIFYLDFDDYSVKLLICRKNH